MSICCSRYDDCDYSACLLLLCSDISFFLLFMLKISFFSASLASSSMYVYWTGLLSLSPLSL